MTCERSVAVGAYVLGALEPVERAEIHAHVATCPACRDELAELAGLPAVLARASLVDVDGSAPAPAPPDAALDRLLRRAAAEREERRRRRVRRSLWAAAAAAVLLVGGLGVVVGDLVAAGGGAGGDRPSEVITLAGTDARTAVHLEVRLRPTGHGTELGARVRGVPPGERCRLVAVDRDGHSEVAATWTATYAGTAEVTGSTAVPAADLGAVRVVADDGTVLAVATSG